MTEKKEAYQEKMQAKLHEWNATIEKLKAQINSAKADAKLQYQNKLNVVLQKKENYQAKLDALQKASKDSWENIKNDIDQATDDFRAALNKVKKIIK